MYYNPCFVILKYFYSFFKKWANPGLFLFIFVLFSLQFQCKLKKAQMVCLGFEPGAAGSMFCYFKYFYSFLKNGPILASFLFIFVLFSLQFQDKLKKAQMVCLGSKPGVAGWQPQTKQQSYGSHNQLTVSFRPILSSLL